MLNDKKIAIVGLGNVGASIAYTLALSKLFNEIVLVDSNVDKAEGEALDISHGLPFLRPMKIVSGSYDDIMDAKIIIITAGAAQKEGETRLDLVNKNVAIFKSIIPEIKNRNYEGILLIVSNPVDILTYVSIKLSSFPKERVIGSGTVLDSARLKYKLGEHLNVDSRSIHAFIVGEHGDSEIVLWSSANVSGIPLHKFCELRGFFDHDYETSKIAFDVKNSAYEIINKKRATYYGIALSTKRIVEAIINDEKAILPISSYIDDEYNMDDVALSLPSLVGKDGLISHIPLELSKEEERKLNESYLSLKEVIKKLDL